MGPAQLWHARTHLKGKPGWLSSEQGTSVRCLERGPLPVPCALTPVLQPSHTPTLPSASVFPCAGWERACKQGEVLCYSTVSATTPPNGVPAVYSLGCSPSPKQSQFPLQGASVHNPIPWPGNHHQFAMLTTKISSLVSSTSHSFKTLSSPGKPSKQTQQVTLPSVDSSRAPCALRTQRKRSQGSQWLRKWLTLLPCSPQD